MALSSLHWDGIYDAYCGTEPDAPLIRRDIAAAYGAADVFLQTAPHMPMTGLANRRPIGPVGRAGTDRRDDLLRGGEDRLVAVTFGGIAGSPTFHGLPRLPGLRWIMPSGWTGNRDDATGIDEAGVPFIDALASADAVITKMGYGTMVEGACNGTRILYADRPDWPEMPHMADWLADHATAQAVPRTVIETGDVAGPLSALLERPVKPPVRPTGIDQAVSVILPLLEAGPPEE